MYRVFTRTWWKNDPEFPNRLRPYIGPKYYLEECKTEEEAKALCNAYSCYNCSHNAGRLSRTVEYEKG